MSPMEVMGATDKPLGSATPIGLSTTPGPDRPKEPDRCTVVSTTPPNISSKDDITPSNTGRYSSGPDTLRKIGMRLWVFYQEHHSVRLYSRRRCRMVTLHTGLFACSVSCYKDIVSATKLWEGPQDSQQVVVITTKDEYTWPQGE